MKLVKTIKANLGLFAALLVGAVASAFGLTALVVISIAIVAGVSLEILIAAIKFGVFTSPRAALRKMKAKRDSKKLVKENRAYWVVGKELDKISDLARYKKDERVIAHPTVKEFELVKKAKQNKRALKQNKKAKRAKTSKEFDKITK